RVAEVRQVGREALPVLAVGGPVVEAALPHPRREDGVPDGRVRLRRRDRGRAERRRLHTRDDDKDRRREPLPESPDHLTPDTPTGPVLHAQLTRDLTLSSGFRRTLRWPGTAPGTRCRRRPRPGPPRLRGGAARCA